MTNDAENARFTLSMVMVVKVEKTVNGQRVGPFIISPSDRLKPRLVQGAENSLTFTITNDSPQPLKLRQAVVDGKNFTAKLDTKEEGKQWMVTVSNGANLTPGQLAETIRVVTDSAEYPELRLQIEASVRAAVQANPGRLTFESLPISNPEYDVSRVGKFIFVSPDRGTNFEITKVSSTLNFLKLEIVKQEGSATVLVRVMFDKDKLTIGDHSGTITIETNNQYSPKLEVAVKVKAQ